MVSIILVALGLATSAPAGAGKMPSTVFFSSSGPGGGSLWAVRSDGSGKRRLRHSVEVGPAGVTAVLARDGKRILCLCHGSEIDSISLDGSQMRKIGHRPPDTKYDLVTLGAGGEAFWFGENYDRLLSERADGTHRRVVAATHNLAFEESVAVTAAGDKVAFTTGKCLGECQEWVSAVWVAPIGGGRKKLAYRSVGQRQIGYLQWSEDGHQLVFLDYPEPEKYELPADPKEHLILDRDGSVSEVNVEAPAGPESPFFSPSGKALAVSDGNGSIYTLGLNGTAPSLLLGGKCSPVHCLFEPQVFGWIPG